MVSGHRRSSKHNIHESMRKADLGTIHGAIAGRFQDGKKGCILGVNDESM